MKRLIFALLFSLNFLFALKPLYNSPEEFIIKAYNGVYENKKMIIGGYHYYDFGLLFTENGSVYFNETDGTYAYHQGEFSANDISDYFERNHNAYVDRWVISPLDDQYTLLPDNISYSAFFVEVEGLKEGFLFQFGPVTTLGEMELGCIMPTTLVADRYKNNPPNNKYYWFFNDDPDLSFASPYIINYDYEPCYISAPYRNIKIQPEKRVQMFWHRLFTKIADPCKQRNSIHRAQSNGSVLCEVCPKGTYADIYTNRCYSAADIENIRNPKNYAEAQCQLKGSTLAYIREGIFITNGLKPYDCVSVCADGKQIPNYRCPAQFRFPTSDLPIICEDEACPDRQQTDDAKNPTKNQNAYTEYKPPEINSSTQKPIEVDKDKTNTNKLCIVGGTCIDFGSGSSGGGGELQPPNMTIDKEKGEICFDDYDKTCIPVKQDEISKGQGNEICVDSTCYEFQGNVKIDTSAGKPQICLESGKCYPFEVESNSGNVGGDNNGGGSGGSGNGGGGDNGNNGGGDGNGGDNGNNGGGKDEGEGEKGECENGECGSYDNSGLGDYEGQVSKLGEGIDGFKNTALESYGNFKGSIDNFISSIENGFKLFQNPASVDTCPLEYDFPILNYKIVKIELDFCKSLSIMNNVFYVIFYVLFFVVFLRFMWRFILHAFPKL